MIEVKRFVIVVEASRVMLARALQRMEEFHPYQEHEQRAIALLLHCKDHRFPLRVRAQFVATPSHNSFKDTEVIERKAAFHIEVQTENQNLKEHLMGAKAIINNTIIGEVVEIKDA